MLTSICFRALLFGFTAVIASIVLNETNALQVDTFEILTDRAWTLMRSHFPGCEFYAITVRADRATVDPKDFLANHFTVKRGNTLYTISNDPNELDYYSLNRVQRHSLPQPDEYIPSTYGHQLDLTEALQLLLRVDEGPWRGFRIAKFRIDPFTPQYGPQVYFTFFRLVRDPISGQQDAFFGYVGCRDLTVNIRPGGPAPGLELMRNGTWNEYTNFPIDERAAIAAGIVDWTEMPT